MLGRLISRIGTTLAWFMPMGTDSSVSRAANQFAAVDIFRPLPVPPPCPTACAAESAVEVRRTEPTYVRTECGNLYDTWTPSVVAPANRAERRDPNFGVMYNRDGSPKLPQPHYVALQSKRDRRKQIERIGGKR